MVSKIPTNLRGILWSRDISKLDLQEDKNYIIHQVLAYGSWEHLKWLFSTYKTGEIKDVFIGHPAKDYTEKTFNFIQKIIFDIPKEKIDERLYVKTYPRVIR